MARQRAIGTIKNFIPFVSAINIYSTTICSHSKHQNSAARPVAGMLFSGARNQTPSSLQLHGDLLNAPGLLPCAAGVLVADIRSISSSSSCLRSSS
jgi:hypothetical protein